MNIPNHVAIILDGNGRWAKKRGMPRTYGHAAGSKNVETILRAAYDMGIQVVTVYAFSTENWSRPKEEVDTLMQLFRDYMKTCKKTAKKNNMKVHVIGDITGLSPDLQEQVLDLEESTKDYDGILFQIALNYGGRDELTRTMRKLAKQVQEGSLLPNEITEELISKNLDTEGGADPDLLIRTSGELRLSNFLPWQLAYTEFYFTDVAWPDFNKEELEKAVAAFSDRKRRYGKV